MQCFCFRSNNKICTTLKIHNTNELFSLTVLSERDIMQTNFYYGIDYGENKMILRLPRLDTGFCSLIAYLKAL